MRKLVEQTSTNIAAFDIGRIIAGARKHDRGIVDAVVPAVNVELVKSI